MPLVVFRIALCALMGLVFDGHGARAGAAAGSGQTGEQQMTTGDKLKDLDIEKLSLEEATQKLGAPETNSFQLSSDIDEFRIELLNFFTPDELASSPLQITEATWAVAPDQNLTIWYRETDNGPVYQHHLMWNPGQEF